MNASSCPAGHGAWFPSRPRCPVCAGPVADLRLPAEGRVLAKTSAAGRVVCIVAFGEVVAPAFLDADAPVGAAVDLAVDADGLLRAAPR